MIRQRDVQWWVLEASKHPESAPAIIEELAKRLVELDAENERLRGDAVRSQAHDLDTVDSAELGALRAKVAELQRLIDESHAQTSLVLVSDRLGAARLDLAGLRRLTAPGSQGLSAGPLLGLRKLVSTRTTDDLLLLTSTGRGKLVRASEIPPVDEATVWQAPASDTDAADEWFAAATTSASPPRFRIVVTRRGFVRPYIRIAFDRAVGRSEKVTESPLDRDEARAIVDGDREDLLVVTRWGKAVRLPQRSVASQGSKVIDLEEDDEVVDALPLQGDAEVLIATAAGYVVRRNASALGPAARAGGSGKPLIRAFDVLAVLPYEPSDQLLYITYSGRLVVKPVREVPLAARLVRGHLLHDLGHDPAIAVALLPASVYPQV